MRLCIWLLLAVPLLAGAVPNPKGDAALGAKLYTAAKCASCHSAKFGGDGARMYTRPDHKVTSHAKLLTQVRMCNTQLNSGWFPEDEENVAAYLNREFYKFK